MVALYISISRISDYKHHPMDVVVGIAVGLVFALITLLILADLFRRPLAFYSETSEDDDLVVEVLLFLNFGEGWPRTLVFHFR